MSLVGKQSARRASVRQMPPERHVSTLSRAATIRKRYDAACARRSRHHATLHEREQPARRAAMTPARRAERPPSHDRQANLRKRGWAARGGRSSQGKEPERKITALSHAQTVIAIQAAAYPERPRLLGERRPHAKGQNDDPPRPIAASGTRSEMSAMRCESKVSFAKLDPFARIDALRMTSGAKRASAKSRCFPRAVATRKAILACGPSLQRPHDSGPDHPSMKRSFDQAAGAYRNELSGRSDGYRRADSSRPSRGLDGHRYSVDGRNSDRVTSTAYVNRAGEHIAFLSSPPARRHPLL